MYCLGMNSEGLHDSEESKGKQNDCDGVRVELKVRSRKMFTNVFHSVE